MSSNFAEYLQRNERFAATDAKRAVPEIPFIPFQQVYLITCIDPRVEPAAVLGAASGEAIAGVARPPAVGRQDRGVRVRRLDRAGHDGRRAGLAPR